MAVASLSGYLYYVIFIDDHSRKTWIYFLKTKDGILARFQEYKARVENLIEKKIKVLRSDNGGEYTSEDFNDFCIEQGSRGSTPFLTTLNEMGLQRGSVVVLIHTYKRGEVSNPLGVSLEAQT
jgi:hypothetical protein